MKRPRMALRAFITALAILVTVPVIVRADLIANGDFEQGGTGWTDEGTVTFPEDIEGNQVAVLTENLMDYVYNAEGTVWQEDDDPPPAYSHTDLAQVVSLIEGIENAQLSFDFTLARVLGDGESDVFYVLLDGLEIFSLSADVGYKTVEDQRIDLSDLAAGDHALVFRVRGEDDWGESMGAPYPLITTVTLDNVALFVVPVPGAALLGGIGLSYAGWRLRRRSGADT